MKRLAVVRLLMLCSEGLLVAFLITWLIAQWRNEDENLRKDLQLRFISATRTATDSLIKTSLRRSPVFSAASDSLLVQENHSFEKTNVPVTVPAQIYIHKQTWSNGRDSVVIRDAPNGLPNMMEGIESILTVFLPDSIRKIMATHDTSLIQRLFVRSIAADQMRFAVKWKLPGEPETGRGIFLRGNGINQLQVINVTGYSPFLLRKILPQILFALVLVLISTIAFWLALRSLQRERRLSIMRSNLVSNMSHELKTPVTTVKVALEALGDEEVLRDRDTVREYVSIANQEMQRLEMLVNQTLHTTLLEAGRLPVHKSSFDLKAMADAVVSSLQPRLEKQNAQIESSFGNGDFTLIADKLHVQGVLLNILDNALKYGGDSVQIRLHGLDKGDFIMLEISDNGLGIPKAYALRVFEKFFRVPSGNVHDVKGYGLGLSYASEVMRLHGGSIELRNNEDSGCTFILQFPKKSQ